MGKITDPELGPREIELLEETRRIWAERERLEREFEAMERERRKLQRAVRKQMADRFIEASSRGIPEEKKRIKLEKFDVSALLDKLGIRKEPNGRFRIRPPWRDDIAGLWINPRALKAYIAGFLNADSIQAKIERTCELYKYLGFQEEEAAIRAMLEKIQQDEQQDAKENMLAERLPRQIVQIGLATAAAIFFCALAAQKTVQKKDMPDAPPEISGSPATTETRLLARITDAPPTGSNPLMPPDQPKILETAGSSSAPVSHSYILKEGDRIWDIVADRMRKKLGDQCRKADILKATRIICERNSIRDRGLGIPAGRYDAGRLFPGFELDLGDIE